MYYFYWYFWYEVDLFFFCWWLLCGVCWVFVVVVGYCGFWGGWLSCWWYWSGLYGCWIEIWCCYFWYCYVWCKWFGGFEKDLICVVWLLGYFVIDVWWWRICGICYVFWCCRLCFEKIDVVGVWIGYLGCYGWWYLVVGSCFLLNGWCVFDVCLFGGMIWWFDGLLVGSI